MIGRAPIPKPVLAYGLLGLIPFLAPPLIGSLFPAWQAPASQVLAAYGALILSFLGGARWGLAIAAPEPSVVVVSLAMLPSLVGLALLLLPVEFRHAQFLGLTAALGLLCIGDAMADSVPSWYARLRIPLTLGAVAGLIGGAVLLPAG
jgi:hypothetical protein